MNFGDLKDSLMNLGKEKTKEVGDQFLTEQQGQEGIVGQGAGMAKNMFDSVFGTDEQSGNPESHEAEPEPPKDA